jgi:hypothetical protein
MSDQAADYDSQYSESSSSSESTLHDILNRPVETRAQANARQTVAFIISATASMNSLKTAAGTSAAPPVPPGTVPITADKDPYTPDPLVPPRSKSPMPNSGKSPRMTVEDMAQLFERLLRGQNAQTPLRASKLYEVTPNTAAKQVPPSEYLQTTTAQSKSYSDLKFSSNVSTNRDTLKCVRILLAECSLISLVDGSRRKSIYSEDNVFGFIPDSVRNNYFVITLVPKDDLFKYAHDCKRLFSIMYLITSKDLHYLINQALTIDDIAVMVNDFWWTAKKRNPLARWEDMRVWMMDLRGAYTLLSFRPEDVGLFAMLLSDDSVYLQMVGNFWLVWDAGDVPGRH